MTNLHLSQKLYTFPVAPELAGVDIYELAAQARQRLGSGVLDCLYAEESKTLSYAPNNNRAVVLRTDGLPGGTFKSLTAGNAASQAIEEGHDEAVTATAGSFGIALGQSALKVTAFIPGGSGPEKKLAMQELGVTVVESGNNVVEAREAAIAFAELAGLKFIEPYAAVPNLGATALLGEAIAGLCPSVTDVVNQFGGGSLHGGVGPMVKKLLEGVSVTVVQAEGCSPFVDSVLTGEVQEFVDVINSRGSYHTRLEGVGVGQTHPFTLGHGSRFVDRVGTVRIDHVRATMYDYQQEHGVRPAFAAAVGLQEVRDLARSPDLHDATIVGILTGLDTGSAPLGYYEAVSRSRRLEDQRRFSMPAA